jgi:hypothetical protein
VEETFFKQWAWGAETQGRNPNVISLYRTVGNHSAHQRPAKHLQHYRSYTSSPPKHIPLCVQAGRNTTPQSILLVDQPSRRPASLLHGTKSSQYKVMPALIPATSHSEGPTERVDLEIQPPQIAPSKVSTNAMNLLLRFEFLVIPVKRSSSLIRSHTRLVITTVGTSPTPRPRLLTYVMWHIST